MNYQLWRGSFVAIFYKIQQLRKNMDSAAQIIENIDKYEK